MMRTGIPCALASVLVVTPCWSSAQAPTSATRSETKTRVTETRISSIRAQSTATVKAADRVLIELHEPDRAREMLLKVIEQDSTYAAPYYRLGVIAQANEQWDDAEEWFESYLERDRTSDWASRAQVEIQRIQAAREADSLAHGPQGRRYAERLALGKRLLRLGTTRGALAAAQDAAQIAPARWEAYALAGAALAQEQQFAWALAYLDTAIAKGRLCQTNAGNEATCGAWARVGPSRDSLAAYAPLDARLPSVSVGDMREVMQLVVSQAEGGASASEGFLGIRGAFLRTDNLGSYYLVNVKPIAPADVIYLSSGESRFRYEFRPTSAISTSEIGTLVVRALAGALGPQGWKQEGSPLKLSGSDTDWASEVGFTSPQHPHVKISVLRRPTTGNIDLLVRRM